MTIYTTPESFEDPTPTAGQRIGGGLGAGLGSGLEILLQSKLQRLGEKEKLAQLESLIGGLGSPAQQQQQAPGREPDISDEQILALSAIDPNLARILQSQKEGRTKATEAKAKREFERAKPVLARADERAEGITQKESSLNLMEDAIQTGNLGFFSPDNLSEVTGIEGLRSAKGAQFISSGKEYFLGSLKRAGARPNQWIEQQIQKMLPKIGRSPEANLTVLEALKSELAVEKEQLDIIDRLSQEDEDNFGYVKNNIDQRTRKELQKFGDQEQKRLEERLRAIQTKPDTTEISVNEILMIDPAGNVRKLKKAQAAEARKEGYKLYK